MSFSEELADNTKQAMVSALLRTVVSDPNRTIGEIQDALQNEVDAPYMPDLFKSVTIRELVQATAMRIRELGAAGGEAPRPPAPATSAAPKEEAPPPAAKASGEKKSKSKKKSPPRSDELGDSGPEDDLEDEETDQPPKKKKKKGKGKGKKDKDKGSKGENGRLSLVDPNDQKAYQSAIVKLLRKNKCVDLETGMSSTEIRKVLGGDPKQFRDNIDACVVAERVHKDGQARGVRYFISK